MKKIIYLNSQTNEEVHYGEYITFHESGTYKNGGKWSSELTFPIVNETIPMLIKKGILVQKEVEEGQEDSQPEIDPNSLTMEEKLDLLASACNKLIHDVGTLKEISVLQSEIITSLNRRVNGRK